jgi:very-short-patch-repair endonuclease
MNTIKESIGVDLSVVKEARREHVFGDMLKPFCNALGFDVRTQVSVGPYRVDFVVGDDVFIEFDEPYHKNQLERDAARERHISAIMSEQNVAVTWLRVQQDQEYAGLARLALILII